MFVVYLYNTRLSKKSKSKALKAAAKDNLSDAVTSLGTSIAILASSFNYPIVDKLVAIIITFFILKTAYDIFIEWPSWRFQRLVRSSPKEGGPTVAISTLISPWK